MSTKRKQIIYKSIKPAIYAVVVIVCSLLVLMQPQPARASNDPDLSGIKLMGLDKASSRFADAEGTVTVAVIDSGMDKDHDWFSGRIHADSTNIADDRASTDYSDDSGHGTHVAGIIAKGTPSNVKIMAIRILQDGGTGEDVATAYDLIAALNYAVEHGADVINMSLGYDTADLKRDLGGTFAPVDAAFKRVRESGCVMLVASGNEGKNIADNYLAYSPDTISVGGLMDDIYTGEYGPLDISNFGEGLDFVAPGYYIESAVPGNKTEMKTGTSMACPHMAAACAIIKLAHPEYDHDSVYKTLRKYAVDLEAEGWDEKTGYGYVDLSEYDGSEVIDDDTGDNTGGDSGDDSGETTSGNSGDGSGGGANDDSVSPVSQDKNRKQTGSSSTNGDVSKSKPSNESITTATSNAKTGSNISKKTDSTITKKNKSLKRSARVYLKKLVRFGKRLRVIWKKQKKVSGYQIRYKMKGQRKYKRITIRKPSARSKVLKKLKNGKKYIVQVRSFRKKGSIVKYGKWSRKLKA